MNGRYRGEGGGGVQMGILGGVCRPVLQILTVFETKKNHFFQPFSDLASKKLCHQYLDKNSSKKGFLKSMITNMHSSLSFLFIWNWNDTYVHTLPLSLENYLIPDLNRQSLYPFLDQNSAKPLPFGVAHTYVAYMREYPLGGVMECWRRRSENVSS